jgi:hypothetical protein
MEISFADAHHLRLSLQASKSSRMHDTGLISLIFVPFIIWARRFSFPMALAKWGIFKWDHRFRLIYTAARFGGPALRARTPSLPGHSFQYPTLRSSFTAAESTPASSLISRENTFPPFRTGDILQTPQLLANARHQSRDGFDGALYACGKIEHA